jgi:D-alanyl-D-alanine carboxypeptidase
MPFTRPLRPLPALLPLLILSVATCIAQAEQLSQKLDQAAAAYESKRHFMGSVLVAKGGKILLEKGYGMADLEWNVANVPEGKFRLGSITKQFTATAIMQLAAQHKLSEDDKACKYFDQCPEPWKQITIRQLLSHTSGIPSYTDSKDFPKPKFLRVPLTQPEILLLTKDKPLDFPPGTKWKYSNSGYIFLGIIIEKVSGEKYADYLKKHIFDPVAMHDSGYDETAEVLPYRVLGYQPCGKSLCNSDYIDMSLPFSAGSLYSTVQDLYKWDRALYTDKVLSKADRDRMWTPVMNNYGYGWMLNKMVNHKQIGHGGGIPGFSTYIARFPDDDAAVIVLGNNVGVSAESVAAALAGTLFGEKVELPGERKAVHIDAKLLDRYLGTYDLGPLQITFTNENGHLMAHVKGQPTFEAIPSSDTEFFLNEVDAVFRFSDIDASGKAQKLELTQSGRTITGKRVSP